MEIMPIYPNNVVGGGIPLVTQGEDKELDRKKLEKTCSEFEAIFIQQMLQSMRKTIISSGLLENGLGKGIYESLFDQQLSQCLANRRGLGVGKMIYDQMMRQEEKKSPVNPEKDRPRTDQVELTIPPAREQRSSHGILGK